MKNKNLSNLFINEKTNDSKLSVMRSERSDLGDFVLNDEAS